MTDVQRVVIGRTMAAIAFVSALAGIAWLVALGYGDVLWSDWVIHNGIVAVGSAVIVWLVVGSQPRNGEVWVFAWTGFFTGLLCLFYGATAQSMANLGISTPVFDLVPSQLPTGTALLVMNLNWLWVPLFLPFTLGLLLFPDGRILSRRWRWVFWLVVAMFVATCVGLMWEARPSGIYPIGETQDTNGGFRSIGTSLVTVGYIGIFAMIPLCIAGLVTRFRRSTGAERQQFRWVVWGAGVAGACLVAAVVFDEVFDRVEVSLVTGVVGMAVLLAAFGIAIGKYRLYDIDVVISRTFVYGSLALFITVLYVGIVIGIGYLFGAHDEPNPWLGLVATVAVAIAFQPARRNLQRVANRVVYGRRATPYEVLSTFSQRVAAVDPEVIRLIARSLVEGTTARGVAIWMNRGTGTHRIAQWPGDVEATEVSGPDQIPAAARLAVVSHDDQTLGFVAVDLEPGQPFTPTDEMLLDQVTAGLGLALKNLLLTEDLRDRVEQLRKSRQRIVEVQDRTRRDLERDLHDGAQQRLVALKIKLGIGVAMAGKAGVEELGEMLRGVQSETDETIESVRDFARGIFPPLLEAEGLGAALSGQARKFSVPVTVHAAGVGRHPRETEATVYFCVLEALQNAAKHSQASSVMVTISDDSRWVSFQVSDDGEGFDMTSPGEGSGLVNIADRVDAVGGTIEVVSAPGKGTSVQGRIPSREMAEA